MELCGIKVNDKYTLKEVNLYNHEIKAVFEYGVRCDNLCIHPKEICSSCRRKMDRCKKGSNQKLMIQKLRIRILWLLVVAATINRIQQLSNEHLTFGKVEI